MDAYGWLALLVGVGSMAVGIAALCMCACNRRKCRRRWTAVKQWPRRIKRGTLWALKWFGIGIAGLILVQFGMRLTSWSLKQGQAPPVSRNPYFREPLPPPLGVPLPGAIPVPSRDTNMVQFGVAGHTRPHRKKKRSTAQSA